MNIIDKFAILDEIAVKKTTYYTHRVIACILTLRISDFGFAILDCSGFGTGIMLHFEA